MPSNQYDLGGQTLIVDGLRVGATRPGQTGSELTGTEITLLDGITPGTATANKAVVLDSNKNISTITSATITTLNSTTGNITNVTSPTNLALNGTSTGTISIGNVSTGAVTITPATTVTGALTPTGGIASAGGFTTSCRNVHTGDTPASATTDGTDATPVNTEVYIAEVFIPSNVTVTGVAVFNGSVASGNMKVGLADSTGAVVATSASTAMSGTDAYQKINFTSTYAAKGPATYYVLQFVDNSTARINTHVLGTFGASKQTGQTYSTGFTTITPPTTFTTGLGPIASLF